jgi:hypothetical protein
MALQVPRDVVVRFHVESKIRPPTPGGSSPFGLAMGAAMEEDDRHASVDPFYRLHRSCDLARRLFERELQSERLSRGDDPPGQYRAKRAGQRPGIAERRAQRVGGSRRDGAAGPAHPARQAGHLL